MAIVGGVLAAWLLSPRRRATPQGTDQRALGWTVADDVSQAVSAALPHESAALNLRSHSHQS
jgi:hypothetical protein